MQEITLNADQLKGSSTFTDFLLDRTAKFMIITGSAGTGKTTLVNSLLATVESRLKMSSILLGTRDNVTNYDIELTATTNKAAAVLAYLTKRPCSTVHSRLGLVPKENWQTGKVNFVRGKRYAPIYDTLLIVDEFSWVTDELLTLIDEATVDCKVLFIGDQYQLASPEETTPSVIKLDCHIASLEKIMRHGGTIAKAGAQFRESVKTGMFFPIIVDGVDIIHANGPTFQRMLDQEFLHPDYCESKARVLAWQNDMVTTYNTYIRSILGYPEQFGEGDVLMTHRSIATNKGILAGTDGSVHITSVGPPEEQMGIMGKLVELNDQDYRFFLPDYPHQASAILKQLSRTKKWPLFFELQKQWLDLRPAFASTVHKAQGSTYDTVFINLTDIGKCRIPSDVARMMYVAVTRAAKRVVLYGQLPPQYTGAFNEQLTAVPA